MIEQQDKIKIIVFNRHKTTKKINYLLIKPYRKDWTIVTGDRTDSDLSYFDTLKLILRQEIVLLLDDINDFYPIFDKPIFIYGVEVKSNFEPNIEEDKRLKYEWCDYSTSIKKLSNIKELSAIKKLNMELKNERTRAR